MSKTLLIGITGGSGSGKTFILDKIQAKFSADETCVISQDNYYRPITEQYIDENGVENFDLPSSIDHLAFAKDLFDLKNGRTIQRQEYVFNNFDVAPKILTFNPAPIIIAEGIFVFYLKEVLEQLDLKIFIDCDRPTMEKRRIHRDGKDRGYDMDDVLYRYEHHVMPAFNEFIVPYKDNADVVIDNIGDKYQRGLIDLISAIKGKLKSR